MVCFIEVDSFGNVVHVCRNPGLTMTPVVNVVSFRDKDGKEMKDVNGRKLGPHGHALEPGGIRISEQVFDEIMANGAEKYMFNHAKRQVERKL